MSKILVISFILIYVAIAQGDNLQWSQIPDLVTDEAEKENASVFEKDTNPVLLPGELNHAFIENVLKSLDTFLEDKEKPLSLFLPAASEASSLESEEQADMPSFKPLQEGPNYHFDFHANDHEEGKPLQQEEPQQLPTVEIEQHVISVEDNSAPIPTSKVDEEMTEARKSELLKAIDSLLPSLSENSGGFFPSHLFYVLLILILVLVLCILYFKYCNEPLTQLVVDQVKSYDGKTVVLLVPISDKCSCPPECSIQLDHVYLDVTKLEKK